METSSSQLTFTPNSMIFQRGRYTINQESIGDVLLCLSDYHRNSMFFPHVNVVYGCLWKHNNRWAHQQKWCNDKADLKNIDPMVTLKHVVRNLNVRADSSLWHNRDNSVLLGSCESKQGQGGKLGHGGMWKIPWIQLSSWGNNITWSSWGIKIRHPLWPICWTG